MGAIDLIRIQSGWRLMSADFSVQANSDSGTEPGYVMFVRDPAKKRLWFALPEEIKESEDGPELYVHGHGVTIEQAIADANRKAVKAMPIISTEGEI